MAEESHTSDQPPRFRFSLARLLVALTVLSLGFGVAGVPMTLFLAGWTSAMLIYFVVAERWGVFAALVAFGMYVWVIFLIASGVQFIFQ